MTIKRVREPFIAIVGGVPRPYTAGQLVDESDPAVKGREHLFEDVETHVENNRARMEEKPRVEQATAGPGERRAVTRPPRPRRAKSKDDKAGEVQ